MAAGVRLTVIVPAWNAADTLGPCLEAICAQRGERDEVLVLDDGSTDATAEIAARFPVTVVRGATRRGVAARRNQGAARARGAWLVFTDADCVLAPGVLERVAARLASPDAPHALVGLYSERCGATNAASVFKNTWIRRGYLAAGERIDWLFGALSALPRERFAAAGGFREEYTCRGGGGDVELGLRLARAGARIELDRSLEVTHLRRHGALGLLANDFRRCAGWTAIGLEALGCRDLLRARRFANVDARHARGLALVALALSAVVLAQAPLAGLALALHAANHLDLYRHVARVGGWRAGLAAPGLLTLSQLACLAALPLGAGHTAARLARELVERRPAARTWQRDGRLRRLVLERLRVEARP